MSPSSTAVAACEVVVARDALLAALSAASRIAAEKPLPILAYARIEATGDRLTWAATNLDLWRSGVLSATVQTPGRALVPVGLLVNVLKTCAVPDVLLAFSEHRVLVTAGAFKAKLPALSIEDFPTTPDATGQPITLNRAALAQLLGRILPVVGGANQKGYFLHGALFQIGPHLVTCVATDGHRLAKATMPHGQTITESIETILPSESIRELVAMCKASDATTVTYSETGQRAHVWTVGDQTLISRTVDGNFPTWERVIPKKVTTRIVCDREAWLSAVRRVAVASSGEQRWIQMTFDGGRVALSAQTVDRGEADDTLPCADIHGPKHTIKLNPIYVAELLDSLDCDAIACELQDEMSPVVFRPQKSDDSEYLGVIMPMRL